MTSDRKALLAAIIANPEEDTPRLVYADWLDEQGDENGDPERARLIRLQIAAAGGTDVVGLEPLERHWEEQNLLNQHGMRWRMESSACFFERGFARYIELDKRFLSDEPETVAAIAAFIEQEPIDRVIAYSHLGPVYPYQLKTKLESPPLQPFWQRLRELDFTHGNLGDANIRLIMENSARLPNLTRLKLYCNNLGPDGAQAIADNLRHFTKLRVLRLGGNYFGHEGARRIAATLRNTSGLEELWLQHSQLPMEMLEAARLLPKLKSISLQGCNLQHLGINGLFHSSTFPELHMLDLQYCNLEPQAISDHMMSADFPKLAELYLSGNQLNDSCVAALCQNTQRYPKLETLWLNNNPHINAQAGATLAQADFPSLREISMDNGPTNVFINTLKELRRRQMEDDSLPITFEKLDLISSQNIKYHDIPSADDVRAARKQRHEQHALVTASHVQGDTRKYR